MDIDNLMKQAQQMQEKMQKMQKEISDMTVIGEAGAGMVRVEMTGSYTVKSVTFKDEILKESKDFIGDTTAAAFNNAAKKIEENGRNKMLELTAGMQLPTTGGIDTTK